MSVLSVCVLECVKRETGKQEEDWRADNFKKRNIGSDPYLKRAYYLAEEIKYTCL